MTVQEIKINPDFERLIPPLSPEEFSQLEQNILEEGIRDPLVVWNGVLVDGHNRYRIAERNGLEFEVVYRDFAREDEAKEWMIRNQFGRRNLSLFVRGELALELEKLLRPKAVENKILSGEMYGNGAKVFVSSQKPIVPVHVTKEVAKLSGIGQQTLSRIKTIKANADDGTIERLAAGEISINQAYTQIKQQERQAERIQTLQDKSNELPDDVFQVIYCDPAWQYSNSGLNGAAASHYMTMPTDEMEKINVRDISDQNSVCFMWATNPLLSDALRLMQSWGFEYKTNLVWIKDKSGYGKLGFYVYGQHELLLIGVRGSMLPIGEKPTSIITGSNSVHSKKPDSVYALIEKMYPGLKYVELFARNSRNGWASWGNQIDSHDQ